MSIANPCNWTWTSPLDLLTCANTVTDNYFGVGFLIAMFTIMLVSFRVNGSNIESSYAGACFITMIVSIIFAALNLVNPFVTVVTTIAVVTSVFFLYRSGKFS